MVLSLSLPCIILLLSKYSTLCSLCQSFRNRNPKAQSNSPSRKGGVLLRSAFARGATKGGGRAKHSFFFYLFFFFPLLSKFFQLEKTYPRKRNKPLQSNDFSSLCLSVRKKILKWYQTHLEEGFWTLQRKVLLSQFHFQIPHFIFESWPGSWV